MSLPHFAKPVSRAWFWLAIVLGPAAYIFFQIRFMAMPLFVWQILCFILPSAALVMLHDLRASWDWQNIWQRFGVVTLFAVSLTATITILDGVREAWFPMPDIIKTVYENLFHANVPWGMFYDVFQIALMPALAEELLFRGVLLTGLLQNFSPRAALVGSSLVFAAYHLNPWQFLFLFVLGYFFGWIYLKTQNLALAMWAHFINNLIGIFLFYW